jgi:hypothetical protein
MGFSMGFAKLYSILCVYIRIYIYVITQNYLVCLKRGNSPPHKEHDDSPVDGLGYVTLNSINSELTYMNFKKGIRVTVYKKAKIGLLLTWHVNRQTKW